MPVGCEQSKTAKKINHHPPATAGNQHHKGRRMDRQLIDAYKRNPRPQLVTVNAGAIERACRAHWPTWDRMRPDHQRKWRAKMETALMALLFADA